MTDNKLMGTCPACGKVPPPTKGNSPRIYCDDACSRVARRQRERERYLDRRRAANLSPFNDRVCSLNGCNKNISENAHPLVRYCSTKCNNKAKEARKRALRAQIRAGEPLQICATDGCNKPVKRRAENTGGMVKFCSRECRIKHYKVADELQRSLAGFARRAAFKGEIRGAGPNYFRNDAANIAATVEILRGYQ